MRNNNATKTQQELAELLHETEQAHAVHENTEKAAGREPMPWILWYAGAMLNNPRFLTIAQAVVAEHNAVDDEGFQFWSKPDSLSPVFV